MPSTNHQGYDKCLSLILVFSIYLSEHIRKKHQFNILRKYRLILNIIYFITTRLRSINFEDIIVTRCLPTYLLRIKTQAWDRHNLIAKIARERDLILISSGSLEEANLRANIGEVPHE